MIGSIKVPGTGSGLAVGFDAEACKMSADVTQSLNLFKRWYGIATRFDKPARRYRAGVALRSLIVWLGQ